MTTDKKDVEVSARTASNTPTDWANDYDIFNPEYVKNPFPIWDEIRSGECPIAHSDRWQGSYMPTRYEDLFKIAQDWRHFSSQQVLVAPFDAAGYSGTQEDLEARLQSEFPDVAAPPITSDPPEHTWARKLLLPPFSIRSVEKFEELTREHCRHLIDGFIADGRADAATDYAQQIPPYVIATMLGIPTEMTPTFVGWVRSLLEFGFFNADGALEARSGLLGFLWGQIQDRKTNPKDDLITYLVQAEVDGKPVPDTHILGTCMLTVLAGIDTTWSSIGSALWHLAQRPDHRKWILDNPDQINNAIEELIRAYSPVTMARMTVEEQEVNGRKICPGDRVIMNFPAANRDPEIFEHPDEVLLDRAKNPHIAFGVGIHRCAGSNLARMEMKVAIEEWLKKIPNYRLEDPESVTWAGGQVRGPRKLPVVFE
jgi:cytochrome P450